MDDVAYMSKESGRLYLMKFCKDIVYMYGSIYLKRYPNEVERDEITEQFSIQRFPGCGGHWIAFHCSERIVLFRTKDRI